MLISEPNFIPDSINWFGSTDGDAAIFVDYNYTKLHCNIANSSEKFVAINCGDYLIVAAYISPNLGLREFNDDLNKLTNVLGNRMDKLIIGGDFNVKARLWGSKW